MFNDAAGVDVRDEVDLLRLKCYEDQMNYIKISPMQSPQIIEHQDETGMIFTLNVKLNHELKRLIMSYGSHIEVLKPKSLRDYIRNEIEKSLKKYQCMSHVVPL